MAGASIQDRCHCWKCAFGTSHSFHSQLHQLFCLPSCDNPKNGPPAVECHNVCRFSVAAVLCGCPDVGSGSVNIDGKGEKIQSNEGTCS